LGSFFNFIGLTLPQPHNTLGKTERLKSRKQIDALFAGGKSFFMHPIKVVYLLSKNNNPINNECSDQSSIPNHQSEIDSPQSSITNHQSEILKVGVSVSKRNFKKATDRNRIKRQLREAYRTQKHALAQVLHQQGMAMEVFFIYTHKALPQFAALQATMATCLARLQKTVETQKP
jgi:ribonuclease P protein component